MPTINNQMNRYIEAVKQRGSLTDLKRSKGAFQKLLDPTDVLPTNKQDVVVDFSRTPKEVQVAKKYMESIPDVRQEKIEALKDSIEKGTYVVDYNKAAEKILNSFINGGI